MAISVRMDRNNRPVYREAQALPTKFQQAIRRGFLNYMGALKVEANKEILYGKKTGRVYWVRRGITRRRHRHQSSARGETHANLSGKLRLSLSWRVEGWERATFGYGVSTNATHVAPVYAPWVEKGTKRMAARPSLLNAIEVVEPEEHMAAAFDWEFRR